MTRPYGAVGYRAVLRLPGVPRAFTAATLGRLSYATVSLSLLTTVQTATTSYPIAGTALGAFGLGGLVMPVKSRLVDRLGRRPLLTLLSVALGSALIAIAVCGSEHVSVGTVYIALAALAGLAAPPLGPSMRAVWAAAIPETATRQRAYSLDAVVEETLFATGPLLVALAVTVSSGTVALLGTAALNLLGSIGLATAPVAVAVAVEPDGPRATVTSIPAARLTGPLHERRFRLLVAVMLGVGLGTGPVDVAVFARASTDGQPGAAGYVLAALSVGSAIGGLLWGHLAHRGRRSIYLGVLVACLALGQTAAALVPSLQLFGSALALTGLVVAPVFVVAYLAADDLSPPGSRTEATTWVVTSANLGTALGAAGAGLVIERGGTAPALLAGAAVLAATAAVTSTCRHLDGRGGW